jgi:hypothetical protein
LDIHEIAHYWSKADADTRDDWINEGLAEFSALLVSEEIVGKEFSSLLVSECQEMVNNSTSETALVDTESSSNALDRELNRYYKPTFLLNEVRQKYGDEKMRSFIRSLYSRFVESNSATIPIFLDEMEKNIGKEARDYFQEAVYRKKWIRASAPAEQLFSPSHAAFLGTWNGLLTQSGMTNRFVLNIKVNEGKLVATLDSPDQNVKDIPVSEVRIDGDNMFLKVSVASATYEGILNRDKMVIAGEFRQRGIGYPLNLSKNK